MANRQQLTLAMSKASNNQGRAYEFACLNSLYLAISKIRSAQIVRNSSYTAAEKAWDTLSDADQTLYSLSAQSTIKTIFSLEPNIVEQTDDMLQLYIQIDKRGCIADVRDIIIERKDIVWEIGLSIKHNHADAKHSRISHTHKWSKSWYGIDCSESYKQEVKDVFDFLKQAQKNV